jgi:hypothetical protein
VEQDNVYKQFVTGTTGPGVFQFDPNFVITAGNSAGWWNNPTNENLAKTKIKTFLCPSDNAQDQTPLFGLFITLYTDQTTLTGGYMPLPRSTDYGRTNYVACAGAIGETESLFWEHYRGIFVNRSKTKVGNINDGSSNTIFFGEALGGTIPARDFEFTWMGTGCLPLAWGLIQPPQWYSYGSKHDGVVQFGFGDGSVRGIRKGVGATGGSTNWYSPDWYDLQRAGGMQDGEVYSVDTLGL